ncbi:MAG TPA: molybdopterin-dependent oxidoreductase [Gemmatimonadaceae bacterium]|nr:molybdopterin-dependent oxidoreductase [Gemmatimonadaceae bacterium]
MSDSAEPTGMKRRTFLKVLGASSAAVATTACSPDDVGKLVPYTVSPDQTVPGVSTYYTSVCRECSTGCGIIAETRDGRTTKLEGNPADPMSRGALCARGQSAVQGLYNPDRFRGPMQRSGTTWKAITWDEATTLVAQRLGAGAANGLFINQHESGSFNTFLEQWLAGAGMRPHLSVDFEADDAAMQAHREAYGVAWPKFDFAAARLIVSFGADFLDGWGASVPQQLDFADARAKGVDAPRFVYVGARRSLTGLNADQWIAARPGSELAILNFLRGQGTAEQAAQAAGVPAAELQALATELRAAQPALVLAGVGTDDALEVARAAAALNQQFGGVGTTVRTDQPVVAYDGMTPIRELFAAVEQMRAGQVPVVFIRGTNPAYYLPKGLDFAGAMAKVPFKVSFSLYPDETTELCDLVLPDLHSLESWGTAQSTRGMVSLQQPAMDPVFPGTRATADVLLGITGRRTAAAPATGAAAAAAVVQNNYRNWLMQQFPGGARAFAAGLASGMVQGTLPARAATAGTMATSVRRAPALAQQQGDFILVTYPSPVFGDGRGANKPWLQELPDPVTKVLWSSWVEIHPDTAERLGIERGDIVEVSANGKSVRAPAYLYLGVRPDTVAMALGQGHRSGILDGWFEYGDTDDDAKRVQWGYGRYARNVGVNPFDVLPAGQNDAGGFAWTSTKVTLRKTGESDTLVSTEGSARQHGRGIAQALTATQLGGLMHGGAAAAEHGGGHAIAGAASHEFQPGLKSPVAADAQGVLGSPSAENQGKDKGLYDPNHPTRMATRRWAMTVDLARCTGCSACVTACYAENNIPTVGAPWQNATVYAVSKPGFNVTRGREMNWIRIERYFEGNEQAQFGEDFETRFVPMMCQHCGNAPCEPVCPVYATYHAPDGLNVQVYNRCVGTRYCSNNCPYKVRYFNWFGYGEEDRKQYAFPEPLNWQLNPDVAVRGKGVMEKCSFCVQRIREAENRAAMEGRELIPDEFTTACAAACPSRAIVFGDAADPNWSVSRLAQDRRAYHVFEELNTYTAVVYLKKVNHPGATAAPAAGASTTAPATAPAAH